MTDNTLQLINSRSPVTRTLKPETKTVRVNSGGSSYRERLNFQFVTLTIDIVADFSEV